MFTHKLPIHTHTHTNIHTLTQTYTNSHTHTLTQTYTHTQTHEHTHTEGYVIKHIIFTHIYVYTSQALEDKGYYTWRKYFLLSFLYRLMKFEAAYRC